MLSFSQTVPKIILFIAAYIILVLQPAEVFGAQSYEIGIVTVNKLNVRPAPGMMNTPLKLIRKGTKVRILKHLNGWLKITHEGQVGYIRNLKRYVRIVSVDTKKKIAKDSNSNIGWFKKEAENIGRKIEKGRVEVQTFTKEEAAIVSSLNDIDMTLNKARRHASALKSQLATLEEKITETKITSKDLNKRIKVSEDYASKRLVALYKLTWLGRIHILASAQSMHELFQRKKTLEHVLAYDENILQNLLDNKVRLQKLLVELNDQKSEKLAFEVDLKKQVAIMSHERAKRSKILDDIRNKKSLKMAALESLKQAAADLDQTIKSLSWDSDPPEQIKSISPKSFSSLKGLLNLPVQGKIVSFFGPYKNTKLNVVNFHSGIKIKADRGEPIRAVYDGNILYASWFKGFGNMIIIDHGNNYYTVYAHAEELFASRGDIIEMGDVVATVGDSGSMIGPSLHFELRHHGRPIDPLQWIKKG